MILCTFGTHPQPFDRALNWVLEAAGEEEVVVQHGATAARPDVERTRWHELVGYDELTELIRAADAVVCHAGVGTLMTVLDLGRKPIAIPRLRAHGEHVDDHQLQIATELERRGYLITCVDQAQFGDAIRATRGVTTVALSTQGELRSPAMIAAGGEPRLRLSDRVGQSGPRRRFRGAGSLAPAPAAWEPAWEPDRRTGRGQPVS